MINFLMMQSFILLCVIGSKNVNHNILVDKNMFLKVLCLPMISVCELSVYSQINGSCLALFSK